MESQAVREQNGWYHAAIRYQYMYWIHAKWEGLLCFRGVRVSLGWYLGRRMEWVKGLLEAAREEMMTDK